MALLVMYGNNARIVDEEIGAMRAAVGSYLVARLSGMIAHLVYSFSSYHHRKQQRLWVALSFFSLCLFIPLFMENISLRSKVAVAWVAIIAEESIWFFSYSPIAKKLLKAKYTTAVDVAHEVDRFAAFFIIVLGEFLYRIIVGSPAVIGFNLGLLRAIWTLIIAFCLNWMYVHSSGSLEQIHPLKHSVAHSYAWVFLHLPLVASLLAGGHAAANTAVYHEEYHHEEMWLLCGGLGCGAIMLWLLASLGECGDAPGVLILRKVDIGVVIIS
jgi:low temperature requirement protein LtrA